MQKSPESSNPYQAPRAAGRISIPAATSDPRTSVGRALGIALLVLAFLGLLPVFFVCTCTTVFTVGEPANDYGPYWGIFAILWWGTPISLLLLVATGYGLVRLLKRR
jgi:hypothetical protein